MREIKFRGWHTTLQKMFSAEEMANDQLTLLPTGRFINVNCASTKLSTIYPKDKFIPLQYTGLNDKNGTEIYEGDILRMEEATAKVVFWERPPEFGLDYYHNEDLWIEDWNLCDDSERMEIIGNIYKNPELLTN